MGPIEDKFRGITTSKKKIAEAIVAKGVPVTDTDTFASYADKVKAIEGEVEKIYKECGFEYAIGKEGALEQMARQSYEITKNWTDYSKARGNKLIRFVPKFDEYFSSDMTGEFEGCSALIDVPFLIGDRWIKDKSLVRVFKGCSSLLMRQWRLDRAIPSLE